MSGEESRLSRWALRSALSWSALLIEPARSRSATAAPPEAVIVHSQASMHTLYATAALEKGHVINAGYDRWHASDDALAAALGRAGLNYAYVVSGRLTAKDLDGVNGRVEIMPLALTVSSEAQALFVIETLRMLGQYHRSVKPLQRIEVVGTIIANTQDGELVVVAPIDYLSWNKTVAAFMRSEGLDADRYSVYLSGDLSKRARTELQQAGWQVHANSKLFVPMLAAKTGK